MIDAVSLLTSILDTSEFSFSIFKVINKQNFGFLYFCSDDPKALFTNYPWLKKQFQSQVQTNLSGYCFFIVGYARKIFVWKETIATIMFQKHHHCSWQTYVI